MISFFPIFYYGCSCRSRKVLNNTNHYLEEYEARPVYGDAGLKKYSLDIKELL